jgi:hypothetical protein
MEQTSIVNNQDHSIGMHIPPPLCSQIRENKRNRPPTQKSFRAFAFILHERTATNVKQIIHQKSLIQSLGEYGPWAK